MDWANRLGLCVMEWAEKDLGWLWLRVKHGFGLISHNHIRGLI